MCTCGPSRRRFATGLVAGAALAVAPSLRGSAGRAGAGRATAPSPTTEVDELVGDGVVGVGVTAELTAADLEIVPRDVWGADLPPRWTPGSEDARFLLVHHTASANHLDPVSVIRQAYAFHTGPAKGWPDVAYNFFVGPDGTVWEGRAGSLAGPVLADATGGNQGFAQLICLVGNFVDTTPTAAAQTSLVRLLAFLANRHGISTWPGSTATFVSRGSNRHPAGTVVTTPTITGHREMSYTLCPGDAAIALLPTWRTRAFEIARASWERDGLQRANRLGLDATPPTS